MIATGSALAAMGAAGRQRIPSHLAWIAALEAGADPAVIFDATTLERLRNE